MFEDLKKHINKENLQKIKKKNRYAEDEALYGKQYLEKKPSQVENHSVDSLSDYELLDREEAFNDLMGSQESQSSHKAFLDCSNIHELAFPSSNGYFTPETKLRELTRELELESEKLRIREEYHEKELKLVKENAQRELKAKQIEIESLRSNLKHEKTREQFIKEQSQEILFLKEKTEDLQRESVDQQQLRKNISDLTVENLSLKRQLEITEKIHEDSKNQSDHEEKLPSRTDDANRKNTLEIERLHGELDSKERQIKNLKRAVKNLQEAVEAEQKDKNLQINRIQRAFEGLQCDLKICIKQNQSLKEELERVQRQRDQSQKSHKNTTTLLTANLQRVSRAYSNLSQNLNQSKSSHPSESAQGTRLSNEHENTLTFNEEIQQSYPHVSSHHRLESGRKSDSRQSKDELNLSPVKPKPLGRARIISCKEPRQKIPANNSFQKNPIHTDGKSKLGVKSIIQEEHDPETYNQTFKASYNQSVEKVKKLERKLQSANHQIVRLLKEKAELHSSKQLYH